MELQSLKREIEILRGKHFNEKVLTKFEEHPKLVQVENEQPTSKMQWKTTNNFRNSSNDDIAGPVNTSPELLDELPSSINPEEEFTSMKSNRQRFIPDSQSKYLKEDSTDPSKVREIAVRAYATTCTESERPRKLSKQIIQITDSDRDQSIQSIPGHIDKSIKLHRLQHIYDKVIQKAR